MNATHYLQQFATWLNRTPIVQFTYRLAAFCCAIVVYIAMFSLMLLLLLPLLVYQLMFTLLAPKQYRHFGNMNADGESTGNHFTAHKLPVLPRW